MLGAVMSDTGFACESADRIRIVNASVDRPWPPSIRMPKIVDVKCGSSDMIQSTEAKKSVIP